MNQVEMAVVAREKQTKNQNRRDRRAGRLPVIVYGGDKKPQAGTIDLIQFEKMLHTYHQSTIFNLTLNGAGEAERAIIRQTQFHPVTDRPLHVDFYRIQVDKPIVLEVPVHGVGGTPAGVKLGGILENMTRRVEIRVLPLEVPESIDIDFSELQIGHSLHVSDLPETEGVEILTAPEAVLFTVSAPKTEEEPKAAEEGEEGEGAAEPEVVGEKSEEEKKEEEGN